MDCLKPGDVAIFTTPLAFRWVHFTYAIHKGLNVFMEKPLTSDGPTSKRMLKLAEQASAKNLKVGVGLMSRHCRGMQELQKRIQDGQIGDLILMRGYRMHGPVGSAFSTRWPGKQNDLPGNPSELLWQISRFHSFIWASGGCYNDFYIHHIDQLCWMKNAWPVKVQALGGRHYKKNAEGKPYVDQNFDTYSVEYIFEDGARLIMDGRCMNGTHPIYSSYAQGSKGNAIVARTNDYNGPQGLYSGQNPTRDKAMWISKEKDEERNPYVNEWNDLLDAIRLNQPYNEVPRGVQACAVTSMGRKAAHTGQELTYEDFLNSEAEYSPNSDKFTMDSAPPVKSDENGFYPIPEPGEKGRSEY
jgi:predicted dehydrogenase